MRVVGIDPGTSGALALHDTDLPVQLSAGLFDLPFTVRVTSTKKKQHELDYARLRDIIWSMQPDVVFIEQVSAMPSIPDEETGERRSMGATSAFRFGGAFFAIKAVVACLGHEPRMVTPQKWKRHHKLRGGERAKEAARLLAIDLRPEFASVLKFKKNHQRAEAYLIAAYGATTFGRNAIDEAMDDEMDEVLSERPDVEDVPE